MKIVCTSQKLKEAVEHAERIVTRHLTLPILNNLLLKTDKNGLKIVSTNLEIGVVSWFPCKVIEAGDITVPAKIFSGIVSALNDDKISLNSKKNNTLEILTEKYKADLKGEDVKDFPIIPVLNKTEVIEVDSGSLCGAIAQVVGFVSNSETRPEITGVFITKNSGDSDIKVVSTDSFRLGEKTITIAEKFGAISFSVIVPAKTATEVIRIFSNMGGNLNIIIEKNQISFELNKVEIVSRLVEGSYPDYKRLIPAEFNTKVMVNKDDFVKTIKLVSIFSGRVNDIKLSFSSKIPKVNIFASDSDLGENTSEVPAEIYGNDLEVKFNWRYLLDGITSSAVNKVTLNFIDESKPCLVKSDQDKSFVYLVMPIRA